MNLHETLYLFGAFNYAVGACLGVAAGKLFGWWAIPVILGLEITHLAIGGML